jgi:hypothetical protein
VAYGRVFERDFDQECHRRGNGVRMAVALALFPAADRALGNGKHPGEFGLRQAERGTRGLEFLISLVEASDPTRSVRR